MDPEATELRRPAGAGRAPDSGPWRARRLVTHSPAPLSELDAALRDAQQGGEAGFVELYRAVQPALLRYLATMVGAQAEDIASETWSQVSRDLARFEGSADSFRGWVSTIGRNRAFDHLRAQARRPSRAVAPEHLLGVAGDQDTADDALEAMSTTRAVSLIAGLPPDQAEAVLLRVVMGLSAKAAAEVLGKQPGAIRTLTYRGLKTLAAHLDRAQP